MDIVAFLRKDDRFEERKPKNPAELKLMFEENGYFAVFSKVKMNYVPKGPHKPGEFHELPENTETWAKAGTTWFQAKKLGTTPFRKHNQNYTQLFLPEQERWETVEEAIERGNDTYRIVKGLMPE